MGAYTTTSLKKSNYKEIIETVRRGYIDNDGVNHRPNTQLATILILEANLGCRIGDIYSHRRYRISTFDDCGSSII